MRDGLFPGPELPTTRKMPSTINYSDNFQQFLLFIIIHQTPHHINLYMAFMEKTIAFQLVCNYTESFPLAGRNLLERISTLLIHQNLGYLLTCPFSNCLARINRHQVALKYLGGEDIGRFPDPWSARGKDCCICLVLSCNFIFTPRMLRSRKTVYILDSIHLDLLIYT